LEQGCTKAARGSTQRCIAHGGGMRCEEEGCSKAALGGTQLCTVHGGAGAATTSEAALLLLFKGGTRT
jgi:hypothetical protein